MPTVREIIEFLEELAPLDLAEDWDNPGLQVAPPDGLSRRVSRVVVGLDVAHVVDAARSAELAVTHHPLHLRPPRRITGHTFSLLRRVLEADTTFYAAHTNWDRADGGVADCLARRLNLRVVDTACDGFGRVCEVRGSEDELLNALRNFSPLTTVYGDWEGVRTVLVVPGAAPGEVTREADGVDVVVSGEVKYHTRAELLDLGVTVVELGHEYSELPGVQELARRVREEFEVEVKVVPPPDLTVIR